jgi:tetratricopeptide (TPR) repeat protein/transcriptional regulator with XRE-family HTH domain
MTHARWRPNDKLRYERRLRGWTLEEVSERLHRLNGAARELGVDSHMIGRWERGVRRPAPRYVALLTRLFELPATELGLVGEDEPERVPYDDPDMTEMKRRAFMAGMSTVALAAATTDPFVRALVRMVDSVSLPGRVAGYEESLENLLLDYSAMPGKPAYVRLDAFLAYVQGELRRNLPEVYRNRLIRVAGWAASLLSSACYDIAEDGAATNNERLAREYGRLTNDNALIAYTLDRRSIRYEDRGEHEEALSLVREGLHVVPVGTAIAARLRWSEATILGKMGNVTTARESATQLREQFERLSDASESSISLNEGGMHRALGNVLFWTGDLDAAERHIGEAVKFYGDGARPGRLAASLLTLAQLQVRRGRPDEAVGSATAALASYAGVHERSRARQFATELLTEHPGYQPAVQLREHLRTLPAPA